jgi:excinuclease ABC subunit C
MPTATQKQIADLLLQGQQNALIYLDRRRSEQRLSLLDENNLFICLKELQDRLGLPKLPRRIECYDISHLSGTFVYGSMVVFIDGRPSKKFYRLFKTKNQKNDDFANHREVLTRRIQRYFDSQKILENSNKILDEINLVDLKTNNEISAANSWVLPDLLIIDGGKGQLSSDNSVLQDFNLENKVPICSIAKRIEEIFSPDREQPEIFSGQTLFLLQRIRDEAHRFAITANREARLKTASKSELDEIPGIGPKTRQKLLQTFGSVKNIIKTMDDNQMLLYELVGQKIVEKLKQHFG